jgi:hypothetical protein
MLKLDPEDFSIECVDAMGRTICTLFAMSGKGRLEACAQAQDRLEESGFDTDWATWGYNGDFLGYRE